MFYDFHTGYFIARKLNFCLWNVTKICISLLKILKRHIELHRRLPVVQNSIKCYKLVLLSRLVQYCRYWFLNLKCRKCVRVLMCFLALMFFTVIINKCVADFEFCVRIRVPINFIKFCILLKFRLSQINNLIWKCFNRCARISGII